MRSSLGRRLEMVARVRSFSRSHPSEEPGYLKILGELEDRLARAESAAGAHVDELAAARSARRRRDNIRRVVHFQLLRYLVEIGQVVAKERTGLASRFKLPVSTVSNRQFAAVVRSMLTVAVSQKEALVRAGMAPTLLDELEAMLVEFKEVTDAVRAARMGHVGALIQLKVVAGELSRLVRVLDGINRWRFRGDPELLDSWNVVKQVGPVRRNGVAPAA